VIQVEPYRKRVAEVIEEEFAQQNISIRDLPDRVQEALKNVERRIAADLEFTARYNAEIVGE